MATRGCSAGANDGFSFFVFGFSLKGKGLYRANRLFRVDGFNVVTNCLEKFKVQSSRFKVAAPVGNVGCVLRTMNLNPWRAGSPAPPTFSYFMGEPKALEQLLEFNVKGVF